MILFLAAATIVGALAGAALGIAQAVEDARMARHMDEMFKDVW